MVGDGWGWLATLGDGWARRNVRIQESFRNLQKSAVFDSKVQHAPMPFGRADFIASRIPLGQGLKVHSHGWVVGLGGLVGWLGKT